MNLFHFHGKLMSIKIDRCFAFTGVVKNVTVCFNAHEVSGVDDNMKAIFFVEITFSRSRTYYSVQKGWGQATF